MVAASYVPIYVTNQHIHFALALRLGMPKHYVAVGCDTIGYNLHFFPKDETMRRKLVSAVKRQIAKWDGLSSSSFCVRGTSKKTVL